MGRKKNPENRTREEEIREKLQESKQVLIAPAISLDEQGVREAFSEFWARVRKEYNRPRDLEPVIWAHLKSSGHDRPEKFEQGLKHFGLRK